MNAIRHGPCPRDSTVRILLQQDDNELHQKVQPDQLKSVSLQIIMQNTLLKAKHLVTCVILAVQMRYITKSQQLVLPTLAALLTALSRGRISLQLARLSPKVTYSAR